MSSRTTVINRRFARWGTDPLFPTRTWHVAVIGLVCIGSSCDSPEIANPLDGVPTTLVLEPEEVMLEWVGASADLTYTILDQNGKPLSILGSWSSSNPEVASILEGKVVAIANGATTVSLTVGGLLDSTMVLVSQVPVSLTLGQSQILFNALGDTAQVEAALDDAGGSGVEGATVAWSVSDSAVAGVNADGRVTARAAGMTNLLATWDTLIASAEIIVSPSPVTLDISLDTLRLGALGQSAKLEAAILDANENTLDPIQPIWSTSDPTVVTVDTTGLVTAIAAGSTTVAATWQGLSDTAVVLVIPTAARLVVSPEELTFTQLGSDSVLSAKLLDSRGAELLGLQPSWTSADSTIATIDNQGVVTSVSYGTITILAAYDTLSATVLVTVSPPPLIAPLLASTLATGAGHACALDSDGMAHCWGEEYGDTPVAVAGGHVFEQISATGGGHTCGLTVLGKVLCWGANNWGQADPSKVGWRVIEPLDVQLTGTIIQIVAGGEFSCALNDEGMATCWGRNNEAQMGRGTTSATEGVGPISGGRVFAQLGIGRAHGCGMTEVGEAYCWGRNATGQIGDGTESMALTPQAVVTSHRFIQVAAGDRSSCAVNVSGEAYCWGSDSRGLLGNGSDPATGTPTKVAGIAGAVRVVVGHQHSCAVVTSGQAFCWGDNGSGNLGTGDGTLAESGVPLPVGGGLSFEQVAAGWDFSCGIEGSGSVYCWGANLVGQLGSGASALQRTPLPVLGGFVWDVVEVGRRFSCGLTSGDAYCWGEGYTDSPGPNLLGGGISFTQISVGWKHACGLDEEGRAHCWGINYLGHLGDGSFTERTTPVAVSSDSVFVDISAGPKHTCAVTGSGVSYCWGDSGSSLFGSTQEGTVNTPVRGVVGLSLKSLVVSLFHGCGLDANAAAYCWGINISGALGSSIPDTSLPIPVTGRHSFSILTVGKSHTCGVDNMGVGWCWGAGHNGRLGNGSLAKAETPIRISGGLSLVDVAAGRNQTCAVTTQGEVYCWGHGLAGELGNGTDDITLTPVLASVDATAVSISVATPSFFDDRSNVCALMADGRAMCWGFNDHGQTGRHVIRFSALPVATDPFP